MPDRDGLEAAGWTLERREGSNLSLSAVESLDRCQDQLQALVDLAAKKEDTAK